jgi:hypothetical protein
MDNLENIREEDIKWLIEETYLKSRNSNLAYFLIEEEIIQELSERLEKYNENKVTIPIKCTSNKFSKTIEKVYTIEELAFLDKEDIFENAMEELRRQGLGFNSDYITFEIDDEIIDKYKL